MDVITYVDVQIIDSLSIRGFASSSISLFLGRVWFFIQIHIVISMSHP